MSATTVNAARLVPTEGVPPADAGEGMIESECSGWQAGESMRSSRQRQYANAKREGKSYCLAREVLLEALQPLGAWLTNDETLQDWSCEGH